MGVEWDKDAAGRAAAMAELHRIGGPSRQTGVDQRSEPGIPSTFINPVAEGILRLVSAVCCRVGKAGYQRCG